MRRLFAAFVASGMLVSQAWADEAVRCVQEYLAYSGFNPGPVDGLMGRKTTQAASDFAAERGSDVPGLTDETAEQWCALADRDAEYTAQRDFDFDGRGILPRDVAYKVLNASTGERDLGCGRLDYKLDILTIARPITRISGFNSRMDNLDSVPHANEAEAFVRDFAAAATSAFARDRDETKTELVKILAKWAEAGAFLGTDSCVTRNGNLITTGSCGEWRRADGKDKSAQKDATHSTFLMAALVRAYYALLKDHEPESLGAEHAAIEGWIRNGFARRLKRPSSVYFGLNMGWYWPSINLDMAAGRTGQARAKLDKVQREIDRLLYSDGSIKDRTTRGDRALWYHYTSIGEIVMSLEMMRMAGVPIRPSVEEKLHKAVDLFVRTTEDYSVIDPWAKKRRNSSYKNRTQDWSRQWWPEYTFAGSWLHVYPYRYPDHPNSAALREKVRWDAKSATQDIDFGVGVGCLYNVAAGRLKF